MSCEPEIPARRQGSDAREASSSASLPDAELWLVDGYNALNTRVFSSIGEDGAAPGIVGSAPAWWSAEARERLVTLAGGFPDQDAEIWILFDGARPSSVTLRREQPSVHVDFAPSADEWIVERVRRAPDPGQIAVVTRDRQVAERVRHRGAQVVWPLQFLARCAVPGGPLGPGAA